MSDYTILIRYPNNSREMWYVRDAKTRKEARESCKGIGQVIRVTLDHEGYTRALRRFCKKRGLSKKTKVQPDTMSACYNFFAIFSYDSRNRPKYEPKPLKWKKRRVLTLPGETCHG